MSDQKFRLSFNGKKLDHQQFEEDEINKYFKIEESYDLTAERSDSLKHDVVFDSKKIIQLKTSSGMEWIGYADDVPEIYGDEASSNRADGIATYHMIPGIKQRGSLDRSGKSDVKNNLLTVIKPDGVKISPRELGEMIDTKQCPNPGLHKIDKNGKVGPLGDIPNDKLCLLIIHGTISSYENGFADIDPDLWSKLVKHYNGYIYAFNHKTITESPVDNVYNLINELPNTVNFDVLSHSRGGLVADTLARCDFRNDVIGFSDEDITLVKSEFDHKEEKESLTKEGYRVADKMVDLNKIVRQKSRKIKINKIVRVACPAAGTTLLSKRLDHFLNAILNVIGEVVDGKKKALYQNIKLFLLKIVEEKSNPEIFPGLWSMVPGSAFQNINNRNTKLSSDLVSISGDSKVGGGFMHSLKVILSNLYYWRENDFVVDTTSMTKGLSNRRSNTYYKIQNKKIDHFKYFSEELHMKIVVSALNNTSLEDISWTNIQKTYNDRGILLDLADMGGIESEIETGEKPIVVLIPGIMGSNIYEKDGSELGDKKWLDFLEINQGALGKSLRKDRYNKTEANTIIAKYYKEFKNHLISNGYDVVVHPYDWRRSLSKSVEDFDAVMNRVINCKHPVRIVAHSMGGLLVRQWKMEKRRSWSDFRSKFGSRFIMLGTPWKGSHLIVEVLAGDSKRVKQLHLLDFHHNKRQLLDNLVPHEGLYDLLPITDKRLLNSSDWKDIYAAAGSRNMSPVQDEQLTYYTKYVGSLRGHLKISEEDRDVIYYIAGKSKKTISSYEIKENFFLGSYVKYKYTAEGDDSVTWKSGIPDGLKSDHLYYINVQHGNLANDKDTFSGLLDVINNGKTNDSAFSTTSLRSGVSRGGGHDDGIDYSEINEVSLLDSDPMDNIFGVSSYREGGAEYQTPIHVEVFNGDLKWSKYPVMVGHFQHDGIVSAESAIDRYFDKKLSERHLMGFYPGKIGEQDIIYDPDNSPIGTIVIGLGDKDDLTGYNLAKSVEKAMLKYAVFFRDNSMDTMNHKEVSTSISTLLIGSNYGQLPMKESIRSILLGVQNANEIINDFKSLKPITKVEFVDYYEDNAYQSYKILQDLEREKNTVKIYLDDEITVGYRNKKRLLRNESRSWWQSFSTELKIDKDCDGKETEYLDFGTYNRQAGASKERVEVNIDLARYIADELSTEQEWDPVNSKVIFEMLLPNRYKDFIRNHRNIEWRFNEEAAVFPWEMFHDFDFGRKPTFIESGLIRQLYSMDSNIRPALVRQDNVLVIANPKFKEEGGLPSLPGAKEEGEEVIKLFKKNEFKVVAKVETGPLEIVKALFSQKFKVLHIASHGLYNMEEGKVGIAIGDGQLLTPGTIKQITAIPEFVFVNCCFSGLIEPKDEAYTKGRNMLAANIGTQLIKMGVKAVVVAGWAVHDGAAKVFAQSLYKSMVAGAFFGDAVKKARLDCYTEYEEFNTWGAYQCYGDQFYRMNMNGNPLDDEDDLTLENEIEMELDNVLSNAKSLEISRNDHSSIAWISNKMQALIERAETLGRYTPEIIEREALILTYLGKYAQAVLKYKELFAQDEGRFGIESFDIYCNIRAKNLIACTGNHCEITGDNIGKILTDMKCINLEEEGSRRLSTMGSTYKRAALLMFDKEDDKKTTKIRKEEIEAVCNYLRQSANHYRRAAEQLGLDNRASIYQVTSYITISSFYNAGVKKGKTYIKSFLDMSIEDYLEKWIAIVDKDYSDRTNIYDQLAKIQLRMVSIVRGIGNQEELTQQIIELYDKQISRCINLKDLIGEIEWIDFQIEMCEIFRGKFEDRIAYFETIKAFLAPFYRISDHVKKE